MASITNQTAGPAAEDTAITNLPLPLTVVEPWPVEKSDGQPHPPQCEAYWDLKREDCARLFPSGRARSQAFRLAGGEWNLFFLSACCNEDQRGEFRCFGLFLGMQPEEEDEGSASGVTVEYEFAARTRQSAEFVGRYRGYYTFTGGKAVGYRNLFAVPWPLFMADDSAFFVDGVLHLRVELTVKQP